MQAIHRIIILAPSDTLKGLFSAGNLAEIENIVPVDFETG